MMSQLRKILLITDTWSETNGVTTTLRHTLRVAEQRGIEFMPIHPGLFPRFPNPVYRQYWHAVPVPGRTRSLLREVQPDAVHIVTEGPLGVLGQREAIRRGWRFTTSFHTRWDYHGKHLLALPPAIAWSWMRRFHARSSRVLAPTPSIIQLLKEQGFTAPLRLWQRGISHALFYPRPKSCRGVQRPISLYVGRVSREKNISAFLDLDLDGTKYVVGDGPMLAHLKRAYHRDVEAGRLVFFGECKGKPLGALYAEADVFVFPSLSETFGNVILEALASGVPVAAYPSPGPTDILSVPGVGALHEELGVAIRQALATGNAEACLAHAQRYTWDAATDQFLGALIPAYPETDTLDAANPALRLRHTA